ncbi:hypothetical protein SAICODRAFT_35170 [Saitoella complicata NRRL Y-17804]|uniref:uncharacterized protein n=1 Tax=Saitoella complicata (strain BCRC 22490 / CBS 7301 / JCM 7358 / NBRC 10748 / NRRL Y-17804) TaxID=698492 RepID=UPI0008673500|nr:uncharacterized protein SAICODRAFT_35170 [Saitoella complicata NRRL Y-17804]ODQ52894.1 hypothetical protein SAICODRAFT_35170 [Saitoella complicata NRRL Y-17804]
MSNAGRWVKALFWGTVIAVGGHQLQYYIMPSEDELVKRLSPALKKEFLEQRQRRAAEDIDNGAQLMAHIRANAQKTEPAWKTDWGKKPDAAAQLDRETAAVGQVPAGLDVKPKP